MIVVGWALRTKEGKGDHGILGTRPRENGLRRVTAHPGSVGSSAIADRKQWAEKVRTQGNDRHKPKGKPDMQKLAEEMAYSRLGVNGPFEELFARVRQLEKENGADLPAMWIWNIAVNDTPAFLSSIQTLKNNEVVEGLKAISATDAKYAYRITLEYIVNPNVHDACEKNALTQMLDQDSIYASKIISGMKETNPQKFAQYKLIVADWLRKKGDTEGEKAWREAK